MWNRRLRFDVSLRDLALRVCLHFLGRLVVHLYMLMYVAVWPDQAVARCLALHFVIKDVRPFSLGHGCLAVSYWKPKITRRAALPVKGYTEVTQSREAKRQPRGIGVNT